MSAEKKYTERDVVLRERAAFTNGMIRMNGEMVQPRPQSPMRWTQAECDQIAARSYPLAKAIRPRVVEDQWGMGWMIRDGVVLYRLCATNEDEPWKDANTEGDHEICVSRLRLWADLLANPTEEVDE